MYISVEKLKKREMIRPGVCRKHFRKDLDYLSTM